MIVAGDQAAGVIEQVYFGAEKGLGQHGAPAFERDLGDAGIDGQRVGFSGGVVCDAVEFIGQCLIFFQQGHESGGPGFGDGFPQVFCIFFEASVGHKYGVTEVVLPSGMGVPESEGVGFQLFFIRRVGFDPKDGCRDHHTEN